ncbi:ketoacyl-ACP synthase III [Streptomyces sp. NBC_01754]|uniref:beta-ketoacyl-ACP synthase III n=1 Tax=Streptomyces sp. NBC_01754 TaxID=2975930 RepID=UPI002DDA8854|nr:beta-ketoacyl-ACP synthase III [Streptomyces sp. NBC_01754]WSC90893.1 ketoacyl-ACP synthase III [Streptomyces sp. NBC_01754]WSC96613.1 ketoacyl-ACP synthase III [Streptomyces sp. NBC_01754]
MTRAAVLSGLGGWLPPRVVTNDDLPAELDTSDHWIRSRTGIARRHFADPGSATSDLAVEAGARALASSGTPHADAVILATTTPDRICPATAPEVATRLGLADAAAFDLNAACTGFMCGLACAAGMIATGVTDRVLVIGAETYSSILDPLDRGTAPIFGDGAGAVVLRAGDPDEPGAIGHIDLGSDGSGAELVGVNGGGSRQRLSDGPEREGERYLTMAGREVFKHAVMRMTASCQTVLERAGRDVDDVDRLVAHQANIRIVHQLADQLRIDRGRVVTNIDRVGNTAAASVPLALLHGVADGAVRPGQQTLLTAFGAGFTWGSTLLTWPELVLRD